MVPEAGGSAPIIANAEADLGFLEHLVASRYMKAKDLERVTTYANEGFMSPIVAVRHLGLMPERQLAQLLSEFTGLPVVEPHHYPEVVPIAEPIGIRYLKKSGVLPLSSSEHAIVLAVTNPFDASIAQSFRLLTNKPVRLSIAIPSELDAAIQRLYGSGRSEVTDIVNGLESEDRLTDAETQRLKEMASEAPIVRLLNLIIAQAVERRASDIHIESYETRVSLRYRIDGVLQDVENPPPQIGPALVSRIKILSKLNIAERRLPQDGRVKLAVIGKLIDFRVSIVPTLHGERIVLRILDHDNSPKTLDSLGLSQATLGRLRHVLTRPNGIFLVTGPTGSGKTTTLYAVLNALPVREKNIITVEDPVEYQLDGVNQIQVKPGIGLTFASILRSILRQDPDIIMVGEIRDPETADIAVHAALTGHLVLSTLHTNSAAGSVSRLLDMGIKGYLLASALEGVLAQRLVRRLCDHCKTETILTSDQAEAIGLPCREASGPAMIFRPDGCPRCAGTGYRGRLVIADLMIVNDELRSLITRGASSHEIEALGMAQSGNRGLRGDGLRLVAEGLTSLEEVSAVASEGDC
jgi:general secretion pathway protein E